MNMKKVYRLKGSRAIEPIFASLILIAIAVTGGIVVYMYTSGYLSGMTGGSSVGQEKLAIETITANPTTGVVSLWCKDLGGGDIIINGAILKNAAGQTVQVLTSLSVTVPASGVMTQVDCAFTAANVVVGNTYTVTLVSQGGNQFVSTSFKA